MARIPFSKSLFCLVGGLVIAFGQSASVTTLMEAGERALASGDLKTAEANFRQVTTLDAKSDAGYYKLALTCLREGKIEDSANALRSAFEINPANTDAGVKLAEIFIMAAGQQPLHATELLGRVKEIGEQLLAKDPKSYDGLRLTAYVALQDGAVPKALELYNAADTVKPNQPEVIMPWATALMVNRQAKEGEQIGLKFLQQRKDYAPIYDLLYGYYVREKNAAGAEKILKAKADAMPDHPEYRIQLASWYGISKNKAAMSRELAAVQAAGPDGHGYVLVGDYLVSLRDLEGARKAYEAGIKAGGKTKLEAQLRLATYYSNLHRLAEAMQVANQAVQDNPGSVDALATRASLTLTTGNSGKLDAAIAELKTLAAKEPENFLVHYVLGRAYLTLGQFKNDQDSINQARTEEEAALKLKPKYPPAMLALAQVDVAANEHNRALDRINDVLKAEPFNQQALLARTSTWISQGQYEKARNYLLKLIEENPGWIEARTQLGDLYRLTKDYAKAEATFREVQKLSPGDDRVWSGLAQTMQDSKRYKDAISILLQETASNPNNQDAHIRLGNVYAIDQQPDKAIEQYRIALKADPTSVDLYGGIADAYRQKRDPQGTLEAMRQAYESNPNGLSARVAYAMTLEEVGKIPEATELYEKIVVEYPNHWVILNNLANRKAEDGKDLETALTYARRAHQIAPQYDTVSDTLALVYIKMKVPDEAIRLLVEAVDHVPDDASFRYHLALAYQQKGDRDKVKQQCEAGLSRIQAKASNARYEAQLRQLLAQN